jgi:PAS domain S-box-containing protein
MLNRRASREHGRIGRSRMTTPPRTIGTSRARRSLPLRVYLFALVALFAVAAVIGVVFIHVQSDRDARDRASADAAFAARVSVKPLDDGLRALRTTLHQLAHSPSLALILKTPSLCTLSYSTTGSFSSGHLDLLRPDGSVLCSSRGAAAAGFAGYGGAAWLAAAQSAPQLLAPVTDAATGAPAALVTDAGAGAIAAAFVDLRPLGPDLASQFGGPRGMEMLMTSADGRTVLARSIDPTRWIGAPVAGTPFATGSGDERPDLGGTTRIYGHASVATAGWIVYAGADRDAALANSTSLFRSSLALIGGAALLVLLAALVVQRRISAPIRRLARAVRDTAPLTGGAPVDVGGPTEVVAVADAINGLIESVHSAQDSLRDSERTYRMLFESNPLSMWVYDVETLRFLQVNDAAVAHYGYSREEFLGMTVLDIPPAEDRPAGIDPDWNPGTVHRSGPWRHAKRDGTVIEVELTSHPVESNGRAGRLVMIEDVTDRERFQRQVQQSQRLESLGQLAGGVAHDFNNLLAVIMNFTSFVKEETAAAAAVDSTRWEPVRQDVEQIEKAAQRASRLVHQLLAFARREVTRPQVLDLNEVVADMDQFLRRSLGEHIVLVTATEVGLWPVLADPGQLEQILVNLAVNARDAMPEGGTLTIETHNIDVDDAYAAGRTGLVPGRYVRLRVSDTGSGMEPSVVQHAFEPFYTTKPRGEGTGLGLATVYGIVTQAGGHAQLYSELGHGTTFTALLPATDQVEGDDAVVPGEASVASPAGKTVLVVEDEDPIREAMMRILSRQGYRVLSAAGGAEAIEVARGLDGAIDLLVTDVIMPGMLGREVADRILALYPDVRVLYVSGFAQPILDAQGTLPSDVVLVEKPFSSSVLLAKVVQVLENSDTVPRA